MLLELTYVEVNEVLRDAWVLSNSTRRTPATSMPTIEEIREVTIVASKIDYISNRAGKATIIMGSSGSIDVEESYESVVFLLKGILAGSSGPHQITKET